MFPALLVQLVISLVIIGLVLWVVGQLPIDDTIKRIINVVVIVCVVLWLLSVLLGYSGGVVYPVPRHG